MTGLWNALDCGFCLRLVVILGHFLWQGALVALAALAAARWAGSASARYRIYLSALLVMAACPLVTLWVLPAHPAVAPAALPAGPAAAASPTPLPAVVTAQPVAAETQRRPSASPAVVARSPAAPAAAALRGHSWRPWAPFVVSAYLFGVALMLARLAMGLHGGHRLRRQAAPVEEPAMLEILRQQAQRLGLRVTPVLAYCRRIAVPTVVGIIKPVVLLPAALAGGLTARQVEAVLAHELAHIRRYDPLINVLQRLIEATLFFHPAVWLISSRVRMEREHCCDDAAAGGKPAVYAESLVQVVELSLAAQAGRDSRITAAALAAAHKPSLLRRRVQRLLSTSLRGEPIRLHRTLPMLILLGATAAFLGSLLISVKAEATAPPVAKDSDVVYNIPRIEGITIDGKPEDWGENGFRHEAFSATADPLLPNADFDARFRLAWDNRGLLMLLAVRDDKISEAAIDDLYKEDSLELFVANRQGGADSIQAVVAPGLDPRYPGLRTKVFDRRTTAQLRTVKAEVTAASARTADGYIIEVLAPWSVLGVEAKMGAEIGCQVQVTDSDGSDRRFQAMWFPQRGAHKDSMKMQRLRLWDKPSDPLRVGDVRDARLLLAAHPPASKRYINVHLVHAQTGQALPDAAVGVSFDGLIGGWQEHWSVTTDAQGACRIELPARPAQEISLVSSKEGFVSLQSNWHSQDGQPAAAPEDLRLPLSPAATIGGVVQNERGEAIVGATVCLSYWDRHATPNSRVEIYEKEITTDKDGRWRYVGVPKALDGQLHLYLSHPDYISDYWKVGIPRPYVPVPPRDKLLDASALSVMKEGFRLRGTVTDMQGKPVAAAIVRTGNGWFPTSTPAETDKDGRYVLGPLPPGQITVTVVVNGHGPDLKRTDLQADGNLDFQLSPGNSLRVRVTDVDGKPIRDAQVSMALWRNARTIDYGHDAYTNSDGRWEWKNAPADALVIDVGKSGYMTAHAQVKAGQEEIVVPLRVVPRFTGTVVDAETGRPVKEFVAFLGYDLVQGFKVQKQWIRATNFSGSEGRYVLTCPEANPNSYIRVESPGYQSAVSPVFPSDQGDREVNFRLQKATNQ